MLHSKCFQVDQTVRTIHPAVSSRFGDAQNDRSVKVIFVLSSVSEVFQMAKGFQSLWMIIPNDLHGKL